MRIALLLFLIKLNLSLDFIVRITTLGGFYKPYLCRLNDVYETLILIYI